MKTNYKVSIQLTRLDITALCHIKMKLEMWWLCQLVSIQLDEMKDVSSGLWQCLQGFYDVDPKIS